MNNLLNLVIENKYIMIGILVVLVLLFMFIQKKQKKGKIKKETSGKKNVYTLKDCKSYEDLEFKIDKYQNDLKSELSKNKRIIENAKKKGYIKASITWTERFQEFTEVSNTLYRNLEYENSKKLKADKFHRYTNLHFRSVILGNLAYQDYMDSKKVRDEISDLLVAIGKKQIQIEATEKRNLYNVKDTCVKTTRYLYDRMIAIQNETGYLRDKIRDECGKRGKKWYAKLQRNKQS